MAGIEHSRAGTGAPPFVFVHGFGCAREDWDAQVAHLGGAHETVAVDLGAHGQTPPRAEHGRIETHGREVADLVASLGLKRAILVGHSMGCRVVLEAALNAPRLVAGVVLVDGSRLGAAGSKQHETTREQIAKVGYPEFVRPLFVAMFTPGFDPPRVEAAIARAVARPAEIAAALFADIGRWDSEKMDAVLAKLHVPLMLIQCTYQDEKRQRRSLKPGQSSPYLDLVRSAVPGGRIETIAGVGHFPQLEAPQAVNALLADFAKSVT